MNKSDRYRQVATLHSTNIDQGFLSTLGPSFLTLVYRAIDEAPSGALIVEEDKNGRVLGFVAGGVGLRAIYLRLLRRPVQLSMALVPSLMRPRRWRPIFDILRYGIASESREHTGLPQAELLSIVVAPDVRGRGVADALYRRLIERFMSQGVGSFQIVVGDALLPAHRFYRRMGAVVAARIEVHAGEGSSIYVQTMPRDS